MRRTLLLAALALFLVLIGPVVSSARAAGLLTPTDPSLPPLRVTDHLVEAIVRDGIAHTTVTQTFHNDTGRRLEATYVFPLPEEADLTDFQMTFNGKMVQGKVLPAAEARRIYESIVRQSKDPGLIEFIGRRLLQMRVFPIEPNSDTTIQVRYQQVCTPVSGMTAFHYPLRTAKTAGQAHGTVRFSVELESAAPLKSIWSPTHAVDIARDGENVAKVAYEASGGSLEEDFLLLYDTDSSDLGMSVVAHKPNDDEPGHFVMLLTPKQLWPDGKPLNQDVVFVVDTSGSMAGEKIDQARDSLAYCIKQLGAGDTFSLVRFSTGFDVLFEGLQPANEANKAKAIDFIEGFAAAGGTNIMDSLEQAISMRPDAGSGRPFVIVFMTDGMGNRQPEEIMQMLGRHDGAAGTIFSFGVGHDVNTMLLDRLAESHGHTTYVQPGQDLELVLGDFFSVISQPVLSDLKLSLPAIGATERFPAKLGTLYHGQQIILAGRYDTAMVGSVKLSAMRGNNRVEFTWEGTSFMNTESAAYVPALWAGRKIAYMIDQIRVHGETDEMVSEIIALSQAYGIQTPYSSWLVAPELVGGPVLARGRAGGRPVAAPRPDGAGEAPASRRRATDALRRLELDDGAAPQAPSTSGRFGDEFGGLDLLAAEQAVTEVSGTAANVIARKNAMLREAESLDAGRMSRDALAMRSIDDQWYSTLGAYLVDMRIEDDTEIVPVRFASDAYFALVGRKDLRGILAARTHVVVMMAEGIAVLISDRVGTETLTDEQRRTFGL